MFIMFSVGWILIPMHLAWYILRPTARILSFSENRGVNPQVYIVWMFHRAIRVLTLKSAIIPISWSTIKLEFSWKLMRRLHILHLKNFHSKIRLEGLSFKARALCFAWPSKRSGVITYYFFPAVVLHLFTGKLKI